MKIQLPNRNCVEDDVRSLTSSGLRQEVRDSSPHLLRSQRGMALVITLILLAVTLIMALAFIAISTRESGSITTSTETATARLAADSALANAEAELAIAAMNNSYNSSLIVSTNYINGFASGVPSLTNVNYVYADGTPLTVADFEQNLANLYYSPRPPVFITTNSGSPLDFRFYLDLNRNEQFDGNGIVPNIEIQGGVAVTNGTIFGIGDPEWIGVLERPDAPYGSNNKFLSRYAFICLPVGYDLNYIHNQVFNSTLGALDANDGFFRNEGVGSWEINLAAFLADLNTNEWSSYVYNEPFNNNSSIAFDDARSLLAYRYANNYSSLATMPTTLGALGYSAYLNGNIDLYTMGNLMTNTQLPFVNYQNPAPPWAGSDNTNYFFDLTKDLFDTTKIAPTNFINHLQQAGNGVSTYDRYTFYRLLAQLGTDSTPESGKMNLNYDNLDPYIPVVGVTNSPSATNFLAWTPLGFFTNAADRMLKLYTANWLAAGTNTVNDFNSFTNTFGASVTNAFGVANIPVLVNGRMVYSAAVQRILQLAANMYDSVYYMDHFVPALGSAPAAYLPSVFQPIFYVTNGNVYITNFAEITDTSFLGNPPRDINAGSSIVAALQPRDLVFGVPLIIGAKKGFPNFNQFAMQTALGLTRKLQMTRTSTDHTVQAASTYPINQMFNLNVSNQLVVECWNSYTNDYTRPVNISATNYMTLALTNDVGFVTYAGLTAGGSIQIQNPNVWSHYDPNNPEPSVQIPVFTNVSMIADSIYHFAPPQLIPDVLNTPYETGVNISTSSSPKYPQPLWGVLVTNNLQVAMVDVSGRIIDYVQLSGPTTNLNINLGTGGFFGTNLNNGIPAGIGNQILVSLGLLGGGTPPNTTYWGTTDPTAAENGIDGFRAFYYGPTTIQLYHNPGEAQIIASALTTNAWQLPYTPSTNFMQYITWQANDPLVHYLASDLNDTEPIKPPIKTMINSVPNDRYQPWNISKQMASVAGIDQNPANLAFKDPLVKSSDYWDFPTNKFPTVGWLGRVHRGTPWQTVYLKASNILKEPDTSPMQSANYGTNTWENWTGDFGSYGYDAANSAPLQDRYLFDLFTTAPNDNATRGQLSVNQVNFPAWSALFSGMIVPTNLFGGYTVINPGGVNATGSAVYQLFTNINDLRSYYTNTTSTGGAFKHIGDVLSAATLTEQSPFLANLNPTTQINDELYEWLPQQMMSLLRVSTVQRYVIYSYGQTLAPAGANAVVTGGNFPGMVTNYQVVAETVTRTVVHFDGAPTNTHAVIESFNILPPQ
jgi:hypothetical protein